MFRYLALILMAHIYLSMGVPTGNFQLGHNIKHNSIAQVCFSSYTISKSTPVLAWCVTQYY